MVDAKNHSTDVIAKPPIPGAKGTARTWQYAARCSCSWIGPNRDRSAAAEEDASAHVLAEIPDDAPGSIYH